MKLAYPSHLPVSERVADIASAIRDHQVVVVAGETGSGKTTQLPKICLGLGRMAIAHTQPRRIAARAVAERLAEELEVPLGDDVGYQVRFTRRATAQTKVKVMTDGVLLAEIAHDRALRRYDTVIVDEAHERSLNIDFLLGYLKRLLPQRPDLRVVITSATIDPQRFARHFSHADLDVPVIEVSGRTYPVEVRYRPPAEEESDQVQAVLDAVEELRAEDPGDILVFLSGEREIRDTADALRRADLPATEVFPLYGRLSSAEQHRVFAPHEESVGRRIVLATNVAETSLTVPGIRYVVDAGTARISRYSARLKVQRLPIEKISQASARQRAGRCGRVADGVCIRLYDEQDFEERPAFTDPEVLRTNLAAVLLQMASLDLGAIEDFPFLDPPDRRAVRDGLALLDELGALERDTGPTRRLTKLGRRLARLPLDPRLGRMVLAASDLGCVRDVVVVAAGLTVADPRERPADAQEQADAAHARFADEASDVVSLLNLWRYIDEQQHALSSSAFRRMCRAEHLHYLRVREWQDLAAQLREVATKDLGLTIGHEWAPAEHVHRALLHGLLSHIGVREGDGRDYLGARGSRFVLWPGSALARKPPRWVMAAELVETSRLFARTVARIEPEWVEEAGAHLLVRTYSEPHWDARRGAVMAYERATLYGVPVVTRRRVTYGGIDPPLAREMFIRHALVEGDWPTHHAFVARNGETLAAARTIEDKLRRRDVVVEDDLFDFYDARVPATVVSGRHFDSWWKSARRQAPNLLDLSLTDLVSAKAGHDAFPDTWRIGALDAPLSYRFAPGEADDGVTVHVPLAALAAVPADAFSWHVPGLRHELGVALVKGLPKHLRRSFVPVPDTVTAALASLPHDEQVAFTSALGRELQRMTGVAVPASAWDVSRLPPHLRMHIAVHGVDDARVAVGDDIDELRTRLAGRLRAAASAVAPSLRRSGLREWPGGALPREVRTERDGFAVVGHPALVDEGETVGVQVLASAEEQEVAMRVGTRRLLLLTVPPPARAVLGSMSARDKLALARDSGGRAAEVVRDAVAAAVDELVQDSGGPAWEAASFTRLRTQVAAGLVARATKVLRDVMALLEVAHEVRDRLATTPTAAWGPSYDDMRAQLAALVPADVATTHGSQRLPHLVRYVSAMRQRLERLPRDPARDIEMMERVHAVEDAWHDALDQLPSSSQVPEPLQEVRWMLEELRVSLFAQQLGTAHPVSEKRILHVVHGR